MSETDDHFGRVEAAILGLEEELIVERQRADKLAVQLAQTAEGALSLVKITTVLRAMVEELTQRVQALEDFRDGKPPGGGR